MSDGPHILVVDDEPDLRQALVELLGTQGFAASAAGDGLEAIREVERLRPAVVLMDVRMPVLDGIAATREISRKWPGTFVVAHSAYQDSTLVRDMIMSGAKGYVLKGAGGEQIIHAIRTTLAQGSMLSEQVARPIVDELESLYRSERERSERLASLVEDLQDAALRDHVTGLFNHRHFHERLAEEVANTEANGRQLGLIILDIDEFKSINDTFGHAQGDIVLQRIAARIRSLVPSSAMAFRIGGDEMAIVLPDTGANAMEVATMICKAVSTLRIDHLPSPTITAGVAFLPEAGPGKQRLMLGADCAMYHAKRAGKNQAALFRPDMEETGRRQTQRADGGSLLGNLLTAALRLHDRETSQHCARVGALSEELGWLLGMAAADVATVRLGGQLHDVGKIGLADDVLTSDGPLDLEGWQDMRDHPSHAEELLAPFFPAAVVACVATHHEQPDGGGYPRGLKAPDIPFTAAVVRVADAFDAMTTDRTYRKALSVPEALAELQRGAGTAFDSQAVDAITRLMATKGEERAA